MIKIQKKSSATPEMLLQIDEKLLFILAFINIWLRKKEYQLLITSIIRPKTNDSGVHALKRAVDFLILDKSNNIPAFNHIYQELLDEINSRFIYDKDRPHLKTLIWHTAKDPKFGGFHFHLQVSGKIDEEL